MGAGHSCRQCIDLLVDYLEGHLAPELEKSLDEHFTACPPCMDFVDQYRAATSLTRKAMQQDMPDDLAAKLGDFLGKLCK